MAASSSLTGATNGDDTEVATAAAAYADARSASQHTLTEHGRRRRLTNDERRMLEEFFERNAHPSLSERQHLAGVLCTNQRSVQIWFQNQRTKYKRSSTRSVGATW